MAEMLVRVVDKVNEDFYRNLRCTKRGMVIVVVPDGHVWSTQELTNPDWRIVKILGVPVHAVSEFVNGVPSDESNPHNKTRQRRAVKLNLDHPSLSAEVKAFVQDATRVVPFFTVPAALLNSVKTSIEPVLDPAV